MKRKPDALPKKKMGRPTKFTKGLAGEICDRVANGEMLLNIVRDSHMPERSTVYLWLERHDDFSDNYARACEISAHALVESGLEILDGSSPDCAHMDNNRANYRKWLAGKRNAGYGDRQAVELTGANGGPVATSVEGNEAHIAAILGKIEEIRRLRREEDHGGTV